MSYQYTNAYFLVYADCIPVKGIKNATITDLTRGTIEIFPATFYTFFDCFKESKIDEIYNMTEPEAHTELTSFIDFLIEKEYGMFVDDPGLFPELELRWESPEIINNAIIDIRNQKHNFANIFEQLNNLGCAYVQIRSFENLYSLSELSSILKLAEESTLKSIDLIIRYNPDYSDQDYMDLFQDHILVASMFIHAAPENRILDVNFGYHEDNPLLKNAIYREIHFLSENINGAYHCGVIDSKYFSIGDTHNFMHNLLFNSCLNKKISIDEHGQIKNCPSMAKTYGQIGEIQLEEVIQHPDFRQFWTIRKSQVDICKACEFRNVCTDCRAYIQDPDSLLSKPLKCGYNPETGIWTDWRTGKEKAIHRYELQEIFA